LLVAAEVPSSQILVTLMLEAILSSETRFLQEPQSVTSQKTALFEVIIEDIRENEHQDNTDVNKSFHGQNVKLQRRV
jgi:hypothetical protein